MPGFKATVVGENFRFEVDDEPQFLDFSRTLHVEAGNATAAEELALSKVREELLAQMLYEEAGEQQIMIEEIRQVDVISDAEEESDFIWYFPDDEDD